MVRCTGEAVAEVQLTRPMRCCSRCLTELREVVEHFFGSLPGGMSRAS